MIQRAWGRYQRLSFNQKLTSSISIASLIIALFALGISYGQLGLDHRVADFEQEVQRTGDAQVEIQLALQNTQSALVEQQLNLQSTQTILDQSLAGIARQQAFPFLKIVGPGASISVNHVETSNSADGTPVLVANGELNFLLANDGGGRASLFNLTWQPQMPADPSFQFDLDAIRLSDGNKISFPLSIDGQSAFAFRADIKSQISWTGDFDWLTEHQLAQQWIEKVQKHPPFVRLDFTNTDPITFTVAKIEYAIPSIVMMRPPDALFQILNTDEVGEKCFYFYLLTLDGHEKEYAGTIETTIQRDNALNAAITITSGDCLVLPIGEYTIQWRIKTAQEGKIQESGIDKFQVDSGSKSVLYIKSTNASSPIYEIIGRITANPVIASILPLLLLAVWTWWYKVKPNSIVQMEVFRGDKRIFTRQILFSDIHNKYELRPRDAQFVFYPIQIRRQKANSNRMRFEYEIRVKKGSSYAVVETIQENGGEIKIPEGLISDDDLLIKLTER